MLYEFRTWNVLSLTLSQRSGTGPGPCYLFSGSAVPDCLHVYNQFGTISTMSTRSDGRATITITTKRAVGTTVVPDDAVL